MCPWCFWWCSMIAQKILRWFRDSPGIMRLWLIWWVWCWHRNAAEGLWKPEGVNILKGQVGVEWGHVAAENIGEHQRILGKKFYVTLCDTMSINDPSAEFSFPFLLSWELTVVVVILFIVGVDTVLASVFLPSVALTGSWGFLGTKQPIIQAASREYHGYG